ncbi:MAG: pyruvate kinase, partial [Clostridia bacterium]|nr:pyruvate kinase [Clostridia bacterium]
MKNSYMQTKIVCTIGPASNSEAVITDLIRAGMNVARLNFSHNTHEDHLETIKLIKKVREKLRTPVAILLDTKGPEIRLRTFQNGSAVLENGAEFTLTTREVIGNETIASITYADLPRQLSAGIRLLLDDGKVELKVKETTETDIVCRVEIGGALSNHKSINIPNF